jgi:hypothetical protein
VKTMNLIIISKIVIFNKSSTKAEIQRNVTTLKLWYNSKIKSVNHFKTPLKALHLLEVS